MMNETLKIIQGLRSIRSFSNKAISSVDLETILHSSVCAANASGRQSYSIVVVEDKELLKQFFYSAVKGLLFCVDYNRIIDMAAHTKNDFEVIGVRAFITGSTDTILVAQTATLAAKSLGIDSLHTNSIHRAPFSEVYKAFNLPEKYCFPLVALCLGYPEQEPTFKRGRITGPGIIHYGQYKRMDDKEMDELVKDYTIAEKRLSNISADKLKENGFDHFLDWFYQAWSKRGFPQPMEELYKILQKIGFLDKELLQ
ncbi:MAG: nitroreductase family protein [Candidatus Heimdallarchaeota archaeon]